MARLINHQAISIPQYIAEVQEENKALLQEMYHIVGQAAAIRYFDMDSRDDFEVVNEILGAKQTKNWMDDAGKLSWRDYREWAGEHSGDSFLFAVHDSRLEKNSQVKKIRGFINIYSKRGEKIRAKRMFKEGIIKKIEGKRFLEVSLALRPPKKGANHSSGLMSSALRQSCLQARSWLNYPKLSDLIIFGFIDPVNKPSIRAIEAAGFVKRGKLKYDSTSDDKSLVYVLSWKKLHKKIQNSLVAAMKNKIKVVLEPQKTDSHCGPAVIKALLRYNGIEVSQDDIVNAAKAKSRIMKYGMKPIQLAIAVKKLSQGKLKFWFRQGTNAKDLGKLIHKHKIPVGINWQGLFYDTLKEEKLKSSTTDHGHYSVVIDINPKKNLIIIDDPYSDYFETPRIFSYKWFKTRWWDSDVIINRKTKEKKMLMTNKLIFIVTPSQATFPQTMGFKDMKSLTELEKEQTDLENNYKLIPSV